MADTGSMVKRVSRIKHHAVSFFMFLSPSSVGWGSFYGCNAEKSFKLRYSANQKHLSLRMRTLFAFSGGVNGMRFSFCQGFPAYNLKQFSAFGKGKSMNFCGNGVSVFHDTPIRF